MNIQRAKEIAAAPEMVLVSYMGVPVVIQQVQEENATAKVYPLELPDEQQTVPVEALTEEFNEPDLPFV